MPSKMEVLWADCIKSLKSIVDLPCSSPAFEAAVMKAGTPLVGLKQQLAAKGFQQAEWEMVVNKLKVPYHLFTACAKSAGAPKPQRDPARKSPFNLAAYGTVGLLHEFTIAARCVPQLGKPMAQQLQQSRLLEKLPALLSAVAAELTSAAEMSDAERKQRMGQGWDPTQQQVPHRIMAEKLLDIVLWLHILQSMHTSPQGLSGVSGSAGLAAGVGQHQQQQQGGATLSLAVMDLVLAVAGNVSRSLVQLGPQDSPDVEDLRTLAKAFSTVQMLCGESLHELLNATATSGAVFGSSAPVLQQVLLSPSLLPCLSLVLAYTMYCQTAEELRQKNAAAAGKADRRSSSSSSQAASNSSSGRLRSSSSGGISPASASLAWQQANQSLPSLPASHQQLCVVLRLDVRMLLTLAAIDTSESAMPRLHGPGIEVADDLLSTYSQLMHLWAQREQLLIWQKKPTAQQRLELQLQLLLPGVLLDCAARIRTSSSGFGKYSLIAAQLSCYALYAWSHITEPSKPLYSSRSRSRQQEWQQLPGPWVAEVLPAAIKLARRMLPTLQQDASLSSDAAHTAGAAATDSEAGSSSSAGTAAGHAALRGAAAAADTAADSVSPYSSKGYRLECTQCLLRFCGTVCEAVVPAGSLGPAAAASGAVTEHEYFGVSQDFAQERYDAMSSLLEGLFDSDSSAATTSHPSSSAAGFSSQPAFTSQFDSTSVVAGGAAHILRVLEGLMRTAATAPAAAFQVLSCPLDIILTDLLEYVPLPTTTSLVRNREHDYKPAAPWLLQVACMAGAGSTQQRALYSVLASVVKLCFVQHIKKGQAALQEPGRCVLMAAEAAAYLLKTNLPSGSEAPAAGTEAAPALSTSDAVAGSVSSSAGNAADSTVRTAVVTASAVGGAAGVSSQASTAGQHGAAAAAAAAAAAGSSTAAGNAAGSSTAAAACIAAAGDAVQLLPSLVIIGRLCLLYGYQFPSKIHVCVQMREIKTKLTNMSQQRYAQLGQMYKREAPRNGVVDVMWRGAPGGGMESKFDLILQACLNWLKGETVSAQLRAAGYNPSLAVQQLQSLVASVAAARGGDTADAAPFEVLAQQLQETGKLLSSFCSKLFCNNPVCCNLSRTLEVSLVSGHSTKCSGCRVARYCQRSPCQTSHWKQHKPVCKALQAATADAAAAAEAAAAAADADAGSTA